MDVGLHLPRPRLDVNLHRGAADALDLGIDFEHVTNPHRLDELHGIDGDGDDAAAGALDGGDAAGLIHAGQHPAAENTPLALVTAGIALMRTVNAPLGIGLLGKHYAAVLRRHLLPQILHRRGAAAPAVRDAERGKPISTAPSVPSTIGALMWPMWAMRKALPRARRGRRRAPRRTCRGSSRAAASGRVRASGRR